MKKVGIITLTKNANYRAIRAGVYFDNLYESFAKVLQKSVDNLLLTKSRMCETR